MNGLYRGQDECDLRRGQGDLYGCQGECVTCREIKVSEWPVQRRSQDECDMSNTLYKEVNWKALLHLIIHLIYNIYGLLMVLVQFCFISSHRQTTTTRWRHSSRSVRGPHTLVATVSNEVC